MKRLALVLLLLGAVPAGAVPLVDIPFQFGGVPLNLHPTVEWLEFFWDDNHDLASPDSILNTDCRHGCTVTPSLPWGFISYVKWEWQDGVGSVLASSRVQWYLNTESGGMGLGLGPAEFRPEPEPAEAVPEPATWLLLASGLAWIRRRSAK